MFGREGFGSLEFDYEPAVNQQIGEVIANQGTVLVIDLNRVLLLDLESRFSQPMCQRILIHLFQVSMAMVGMNVIRGLSDEITMRFHLFLSWLHDAIQDVGTADARNFLLYQTNV